MNADPESARGAERLASATRALQALETGPPGNELIEAARRVMVRTPRRLAWPAIARRGAAALAVIGLAAAIYQLSPTGALAEVAKRVDATKTLRAVIIHKGEGPKGGGTLYVSGTRRRMDSAGGVLLADSAANEELMLDSENKLAYWLPAERTGWALDFYAVFRALADAATTPIDPHIDTSGQRFPGFAGQAKVDIGGQRTWNVAVNVWSSPATLLPVRLEIQPTDQPGERIIVEQIEFDVPLNDVDFAIEIPPGFSMAGLSPAQLQAPPDEFEAATLTITPGVGVGAVKFGMSRDEIVAVLGEPEFTLHNVYLNYPSKGLQLTLVGRQPDRLGMIIANPFDAASMVRNEFPGQMDSGIRIGSSKNDVFGAYGPPDPPLASDRPGSDLARYKKLALMFSFADGKVVQIIVSRID